MDSVKLECAWKCLAMSRHFAECKVLVLGLSPLHAGGDVLSVAGSEVEKAQRT